MATDYKTQSLPDGEIAAPAGTDIVMVTADPGGNPIDYWCQIYNLVPKTSAAEINTGTDANKQVTADAIAGSNVGTAKIQIAVIPAGTALTVGDQKFVFVVPLELNGMNLVDADASLTGVVATGATLPNISLYNKTDSVDMLSTPITIDASEWNSYTAAAQPVIDAAHDDVATGDRIEINIDAVGNTTPGYGLNVMMSFRLP